MVGNLSSMAAHCEDESDAMSYLKRDPSAPNPAYFNWWDVGDLAAASIALNIGEVSGEADNPAMLARVMRTTAAVSPLLPTTAELLCSILAPALRIASEYTPFSLVSCGHIIKKT